MISTLELQNFRGLEHVQFENLGRANLIVGGNNAGKTSVLEALTILFGNSSQLQNLPTTFRSAPRNQQNTVEGFWKLLGKNGDWTGLQIKTDSDSIKSERLPAQRNPDGWQLCLIPPNSPTVMPIVTFEGESIGFSRVTSRYRSSVLSTKQQDPGEISELFNQIAPLNPENELRLEELLKASIEPRLRRLRYARPQKTNTHLVYADVGEGPMLPFTQLGQAFSRALQVYCEIFANRPKILLIDEIENGLYHEGLEDYWSGLLEVLEDQDVQLFATTHSRECMEAAHRAAKKRADYPLRYLRLDRKVNDPSKIVGSTFAGEEMQTAIDSNFEMR